MKALITGASSGIGREMARYLASLGWDLILVARRYDRLKSLKDELKNVNVRLISCNLNNLEEVKVLYEGTKADDIDLLINNAGFGLAGRFTKTDLDREIEMINTNIIAVHVLTKLFLMDFVKKDKGRILNVASSAGFLAGPLLSTYYASKNYVLRLSEAVYEELRRKKSNVHISVLCPGPVNTEFNDVADVAFAINGMDAYTVARYAIDKTLDNKLIIIPGLTLKAGLFFRRFLSEKQLLNISYNIQKKKNEED